MRRSLLLCAVAAAIPLFSGTARAVPIDGTLDPDYGAALSTQTTQTSLGDQPSDFIYGSELDEAYGFVSGDVLNLFFSGSFNRYYGEPLTDPNYLELFIDTGPGGQNVLSASNPSLGNYVKLQSMAGLKFDPEFSPDYWFGAALEQTTRFYVYYAELPAGGGGTGYWLGSSDIGGPGTLSGAGSNNPFGVLASIDLSNEAGVTGGCSSASGAGVTTGIELAIPLAAIGNPTGTIRASALLVKATPPTPDVSNQVLGPVPPGTCALGPANGVDFGTIQGAQYFIIDAAVPATRTTWGRLKASYR